MGKLKKYHIYIIVSYSGLYSTVINFNILYVVLFLRLHLPQTWVEKIFLSKNLINSKLLCL